MITILSYVSNDYYMDIQMPTSFARFILDVVTGENVLIGRKTFEQEMQEQGTPGTKTFVLSRSHKFRGAKHVKEPSDFRDGFVMGGRSTIASMMPFAQNLILGVDKSNVGFGDKFPNITGFSLVETVPDDDFDVLFYKKVRFSK